MRLLLELALTHVLGRGRQTVVAGLGVALGVPALTGLMNDP